MVSPIPDNGLWSDISSLINGNFNEVQSTKQVYVSESLVAQAPTAENAPLTIEYGTPSVDTGEVSVTGGVITVNTAGLYFTQLGLQVGRVGSGGQAIILIRTLVDGVQASPTSSFIINAANDTAFYSYTSLTTITVPGTTFAVQIARDGSGSNAGGLYPQTVDPALIAAGWRQGSAAEIVITKMTTIP